MPTSPCSVCGATLKHADGVTRYRCPRCKTITSVGDTKSTAGNQRRSPAPPRPRAWRVPFNDGWAGTSIFVAVTLVASAIAFQFTSDPYQPAFLVIALAVAVVAALIVGLRVRRFRSLFENGIVLRARVRAHNRTETHVGKVHTLSSLFYDYDYNGNHYEGGIPYATGSPGWRKAGKKIRANKMDVSTWLLALNDGDTIDILISDAAPQKSYIVRLYTGVCE